MTHHDHPPHRSSSSFHPYDVSPNTLLLCRIFVTWKTRTRDRIRRERKRMHIWCYLTKGALRYWNLWSRRKGMARRAWRRAVIRGNERTQRVYFNIWAKFTEVEQKNYQATLAQGESYKSIGAGLGLLRWLWHNGTARVCLRKWYDNM